MKKRNDWWMAIAGLVVVAVVAVGLGLLLRGQQQTPLATEPTATATAQPAATQQATATATTVIVPTGTALTPPTAATVVMPTETAQPEPVTPISVLDGYIFSEPRVVLTNTRYIQIAGWLPDSENVLITRGDPERPLREFIETFNVRTGTTHRFGERLSLAAKPLWLPALQGVAYTDWVGKEYRALYTSRGETEKQTIAPKLSSLHIGADPSGQQIAFFTEAAGEHPQLWETLQDTIQALPFALAPLAYTVGPMMPSPYLMAWHPTEDKVAFYNNYHFFVANLDVGQVQEIDLGDIDPVLELWAVDAQWSPDGRYIALCVTEEPAGFSFFDLAVLDTNTEKFHGLDRDPIDKNIVVQDIAWAPDGRHLLILGELTLQERETEGVSSHLYLVDALTGEFRPILSDHALGGGDGGWNLAWSPDGQQLAVNCPTSEEGRLCVIAVTAP